MNKFVIIATLACMGAVFYQCEKTVNDEKPAANVNTAAADTVTLINLDNINCRIINKGDTSWIESIVNGAPGKGERVRYLREDGIIVRADVYKVGKDGRVACKLVVDTAGLVMLADSCTPMADGRAKYRIINYYPNGLVKSTGWAIDEGNDQYTPMGEWEHFNADGFRAEGI